MKKHVLLTALWGAVTAVCAFGQQQIPNSNFEIWQNVGSNTEEPDNWNGIKTGTGGLVGLAPKTIQRSTTIRPGTSGQYSARVFTVTTFGTNANGNLTCGRVNAGSTTPTNSSNYNYSQITDANFSEAFTSWPDSIVFWAKYNPSNQNSTARVNAVIHNNNSYRDPMDAASPSYIVASAGLNYTSNGNVWQRISVPFNYTGPATAPSFILITFTSNSTPGGGNGGDEVFIDDMEFIYNPITTTATTLSPLVYNVSTTQGTSISIPFTKTGIFQFGNTFTAQLSDASGSFASPVNIGTLSGTAAGTINATIPAGTPSGTGYRVRVIASSPYQTANANVDNITINLVNNSIAPIASQTIAANSNGTNLTVTENPAAGSRVWKFSTSSGGPYQNFSPSQTGTSYTPNFASAGTYYVVCESTFGILNTRSNEVTINVVGNSISPSGSQSLLESVPGTTLTVTETPSGSSREWKYASNAGGPYISFGPAETGNTYIPVFASAGTYYVICESVISGVNVSSNEVTISVGSVTISTGTIAGSPFEFSASAPNASVDVPFTVSQAFAGGNVFSAELSDANGSFASATTIGTLAGTGSGTISATIPAGTAQGSGYLIRVKGSLPSVTGSDNGTALTIDQYSNSVSPATSQTITINTAGTSLSVSESQNTLSREWKFSNTSGGAYQSFNPAQTGTSFSPIFDTPGTYFVICESSNQYSDAVISNEVEITVENGTSFNTGTIAGSPYYISPSANNVINVPVSGNVIFDANNVFTVELSNDQGSFAIPTVIGTLNGSSASGLTGLIPNNIADGNGYRVRVLSSSPAITGNDNGSDLSVVTYTAQATPVDTQFININESNAPLSFTCSHPGVSVEWKYRTSIIGGYLSFNPPKTGNTFINTFTQSSLFYIVAEGVNQWGDTVQTVPVMVSVFNNFSIDENASNLVQAYWYDGNIFLNLTETGFNQPKLEIIDMQGRVIFQQQITNNSSLHTIPFQYASGVYSFRITEGNKYALGKISVTN